MNSTKTRLVFPLLIIGLLVIIGISLSIGRFTVPFDQTVRILGSQILPLETTWTNGMENVIINVRLPRVIAGLIVGAALLTKVFSKTRWSPQTCWVFLPEPALVLLSLLSCMAEP